MRIKITSALLTACMLMLAAPAAAFGSILPKMRSREEGTNSHAVGALIAGSVGILIVAVVIVSVVIPTITGLNTSGMSSQTVGIINTIPTLMALVLLVAVASLILNLFAGRQ